MFSPESCMRSCSSDSLTSICVGTLIFSVRPSRKSRAPLAVSLSASSGVATKGSAGSAGAATVTGSGMGSRISLRSLSLRLRDLRFSLFSGFASAGAASWTGSSLTSAAGSSAFSAFFTGAALGALCSALAGLLSRFFSRLRPCAG